MRSRFHWLVIGALALAACGDGAATQADAALGGADAHIDDSDAAGVGCYGMERHDCQARVDCVFDVCLGCDCAPLAGSSCRGINDSPTNCPPIDCGSPSCCSAEEDCTGGANCETPGTPTGCGVCFPGPGDCTTDETCATGSICQPIHCSCDGASSCTAGCTADADCGEAEHCNLTVHPRCLPDACSAAMPCPGDFSCDGNGKCQRKLCKSDDDCAGFCVLGHCYAGYGECRLPVP